MIEKNDPLEKDDARLTSFVLGELSEEEAAEIQSAIAQSPELENAVEEIRQTVSLLGAAYQAEAPLSLLDSQKAELVEARGDEAGVGLASVGIGKAADSSPRSTRKPWLPIALAAGLLGVLVGGAFYYNNLPTDPALVKRLEVFESKDRDEVFEAQDKEFKKDQDSFESVTMAETDSKEAEVQKLVSEYNEAVDSEDFDRAEMLSKQAAEIAPDSDISEILNEKSKLLSRMERVAKSRDDKEEGFFEVLQATEPPMSPIPGSGEMDFGDSAPSDEAKVQASIAPRREQRSVDGIGGQGKGGMGGDSASRDAGGDRELAQSNSSQGQSDGKFDDAITGKQAGKDSMERQRDLGGVASESSRPAERLAAIAPIQNDGQARSATRSIELGSNASESLEEVEDLNASIQAPSREMLLSESERIQVIEQKLQEERPRPNSLPAREMGRGEIELRKHSEGLEEEHTPGDRESDLATPRIIIQENNEEPALPAMRPKPAPEMQDQRGAQSDFFDEGIVGGTRIEGKDGISGDTPVDGDSEDMVDEFKIPNDSVDAAKPRTAVPKFNKKRSSGKEAEQFGLTELGLSVQQDTRTETKTRSVPVTKNRTELRTRTITKEDGSVVEENYSVNVPYTEQVTQNYTVQVPVTSVDLKSDESQKIVDRLAARFDPNMKREFGLKELFDNVESLGEANSAGDDAGENGEVQELKLARKLIELNELAASADGRAGGKGKLDTAPALEKLNRALQRRNAKVRQTRTWKKVKATPNTTRLMVGDKDELDLTGMQVNVQVDGFRARVLIDSFYYNDRPNQLEGNFKLRLPDDASLFYFAFGESAYDLQPQGKLAQEEFFDDGTQFVSLNAKSVRDARQDSWKNVKESRMVPREKAAHAFRETVRRKVDPALVEWSGAGVFNARVFPLAPRKLHRIVIGYDVNLKKSDGEWVYDLQLPEQPGECQVDLNVQPIDGVEYSVNRKSDPIENEINGKTVRRYTFKGPKLGTVRLTARNVPEVMLQSSSETDGDFWGVQVIPELPVEEVAGSPQAIFMLDTSLSSNPDKFNVWLNLLETTLNSNRDSLKRFNVLFFNVDGHFWQDKWVENTEANTNKLIEKCNTLALEGATDLYGALETVSQAKWVDEASDDESYDEKAKSTAAPDLFLLSDGAANWGETNVRLISRQLQDHQLGSMFAYQTGMTGTAIANLRFIAGESGGAVFSVTTEDEVKTAAMAHRKRPWKLASISAEGATDIMTAGRVQWVYPGQAITVVGRGSIEKTLTLDLEQAGKTKTISIEPSAVESELASRLYGQVAVGQLECVGGQVFDVGASYARHFRVTGDTCSLLMLESEADYQRFNIKPQEDLFVIKTQMANDYVSKTLSRSAAELADPKAQLTSWLARLESMPGMSFKMPTALKLALDDMKIVAVSKPLNCELRTKDGLSKGYLDEILKENLDYGVVSAEANRRGGSLVDEAIKVYSSMVERNPGDLVIARDVAYSALEMGRPAQAYHLLRSVAKARPFEGSIYPALGQCLMQLGEADMAIVYYEIALGGSFNRMGSDFKRIVSAEYMYLLRQVIDGRVESSVKDFASARHDTLKKNLNFKSADVVITMMWNTDQTDVDLHIVEPSGEECSYENTRTRSGGTITSDITTGFGPEMYANAEAPSGKYDIKVKYFAKNQNRTGLRNKVHLTIYRGFGTEKERVTRRTVELKKVGEKESVATIGVE